MVNHWLNLRKLICSLALAVGVMPGFVFSANAPITSIGNYTPCPNTQLTVPVLVNGFTAITGVTLEITYDPLVLTSLSCTNAQSSILSGMLIVVQPGSGGLNQINVLWSDITPRSLDPIDTLLYLTFTFAASCGTTGFTFIPAGTPGCEYDDATFTKMNDLPYSTYYINGQVSCGAVPQAGVINGSSQVCQVSAGIAYSIIPLANATSYVWSYPDNATIIAGATTNSVLLDFPAGTPAGNLQVFGVSTVCGSGPASPAFPVVIVPRPVPVITGSDSVCPGSTSTYTTDPLMSGYNWTVPTGGTIASGAGTNSITVNWTTPGSHSVTLNYIGSNGCEALIPAVKALFVRTAPVAAINGSATGCMNTPASYSTDGGMSGYLWTVTGGTFTGQGTSDISVTWNVTGNQSITVTYQTPSGCSPAAPTSKNVTVNPLPVPVIIGYSTACMNSAGNVYGTPAGMTNYLWNVTGGTVTAGGTTSSNSVTITWTSLGAQTISLNYTNANGCSAATPTIKNVTVNPLPAPTLNGPASVCEGSAGNIYTTEPGLTNYTWTVSPEGTVTAGGGLGSNTITVTWNSAGARQISVNYNNSFGCAAVTPAIFPVTVSAIPVPTITGPSDVCLNSVSNVYRTQAGMVNYSWIVSAGGTITAGGTSASDSVRVTWNTAGPQTISVGYTNVVCASLSPALKNITVNTLPSPTLSGNATVCAGTAGNIYSTESGMSGYAWSVSAGGTITAGGDPLSNTATVTWSTAGSQTISVNYSDANGCRAMLPAVHTITVNPLPVPVISGATGVCAGTSGSVYNSQPGMTNYSWLVSAGGVVTAGGGSTSNSVTVTWNVAGPQTVSLSYTNGNGCTALNPTIYPVTVHPIPVPSILGAVSGCVGTSGNIFSTEAGMSNYVWTVSSGGTITSGAGTNAIAIAWGTTGVKTITVSYTSQYGCATAVPSSYSVTVYPLPVPVITGPSTVCAGSTGNIYTTQSGMTGYVWNVTGGTITAGAGNDTIVVTWNTIGNQIVSLNYINSNGCSAATPVTKNVTVLSAPSPAIAGPVSKCAGSTGVVYMTAGGMSSYQWAVSAGGTITAGGGTSNNTVTISWNTAGPQWVSVNYTNAGGCQAPAPTTLNVTVHPLPVPTITGDASECVNATAMYITEAGMTGYQWTVSAGGVITSGFSNDTCIVQWTTAGNKTVNVNYFTPAGCTAGSPSSFSLVVNPLPMPSITGPNLLCVGGPAVIYSTEQGKINYSWAVTGDTITSGQGTDAITVNWTTPGIHTVSVIYTEPLTGCTAVTAGTKSVNVNPIPVPTIAGNSNLCVNSGTYTYTTQAGGINYLWTVSAGGFIVNQNANSLQVMWLSAGAQSVTVTYNSQAGCTPAAPGTLAVTVNPKPGAAGAISGPSLVCKPENGLVYSVDPIPDALNYVWTLPPGAAIEGASNLQTVTINFSNSAQSGNIIVYGTNSCGTGLNSPPLHVSVHAVPETPVISFLDSDSLISSANYGNEWYLDGVPLGISGQICPIALPGKYFTIVTQSSCTSDTSNIIEIINVGIKDHQGSSVTVYPNPNSGRFNIGISTPAATEYLLQVINSTGKQVMPSEKVVISGRTTKVMDLGNLPRGLYWIILRSDNDRIIRHVILD